MRSKTLRWETQHKLGEGCLIVVMATEKFTVILQDKSGQQTIYFSYNLTLQVLAGFGNWKETGNAKPLTAITSYMTQNRPFFPTLFQEHQEFLQAWVWHLIYCPLSPGLF